jgi:dihydrofolate synthase/folylpolyglutamate synthase
MRRVEPDPAVRMAGALARMVALVVWERRDRGSMRQVLDSMIDLLRRLASPEAGLRVVQVAGTKGKGSVARLVAEGLERAGLQVGCYASPHVERVNERVLLNGREVGDEVLADALEQALAAREEALREGSPAGGATWFDLMTAAALRVFAVSSLDWAVIEVGLGGRLDSTNVLHAELCVITTIDLEHTAVRGTTRRAIALEKAGILEEKGVLVTGLRAIAGLEHEDDAHTTVMEVARRLAVVVREAAPATGTSVSAFNVALARAVLDELGALGHRDGAGGRLSAGWIDEAAQLTARLPGRLERRRLEGVPIVLDGAHVAASMSLVLEELGADPGLPGRPVGVLALGRDKDARACLKALRRGVDTLACTFVEGSQHSAPAELGALARECGFTVEIFERPERALAWARERARDGWILVTGSLYLAGALRPRTEPADTSRC